MPKKIYNKLVRDRIPEIIEASNETAHTKILSSEQYLPALLAKLKEEVAEFEADLSIKELADVQEVILALMKELNLDAVEVEKVRQQRANDRGAFEKRIFLESVES